MSNEPGTDSMPKAPAKVIDQSDTSWHFDRKIPVALIVTMVVAFMGQAVVFLIWGATAATRLTNLERLVELSAPLAERTTRVEENLKSIQSGIGEIKTDLRAVLAAQKR